MIKRLDPKAVLRIVSQFDPGLLEESKEEIEELRKVGKSTRFEQFLETLDLSVLQAKEGDALTVFQIRCLLVSEVAEINKKYLTVDTEKKLVDYKDRDMMYAEIAAKCVLGIEEDGICNPISVDEMGYTVANGLGAVIWTLTTLRKNSKNG